MLTQVEWSKTNPNPLQSGIVEIFARESAVIEHLPFVNIVGGAYVYNREETLPGVAFRNVNEGYVESTGVLNQQVESLKILGGDSSIDVAQVKMGLGDSSSRAIYDSLKAKSLSATWTKAFFDGDVSTNPKEFDGLNRRLIGNQSFNAGTNGGALTLSMLDDLIDRVVGTPTLLLMNKGVRRKLTDLARSTPNLQWAVDDFGRTIALYAGIPLGIVEDDASGTPILGFDETVGSSDVTSSIYAVRFDPSTFHGIQVGPIEARDIGELESRPAFVTRIEWIAGLALRHGRAAARLAGVLAPA